MIYLTFGEWARARGLPPMITFSGNIDRVKMQMRYSAETIFEFIDGKTVYHKDRNGTDHQYPEDEIIMFKLKNG